MQIPIFGFVIFDYVEKENDLLLRDYLQISPLILTHFSPVSYFYIPWKRQKTVGFLTFSEDIEMWHWTKMG